MASTDRDRGILMAQGAWRTFRHTSESEEAFAARMAEIAESRGLQAAAEAIARDCKEHGLEMSAGRVLKGLAHDLARGGTPGPRPMPEGLRRLVEGESAERSSAPTGLIAVFVAAALLFLAWLWFR
jgi:hypothetical protein